MGSQAEVVRVLLIEDNPDDARLLQEALRTTRGPTFQVARAVRLSEGLARSAGGTIDVILLDLGLPDSRGLDTLLKVRAQAPEAPVVVLTGLDDEGLAIQAVQEGAQDYLVKGQINGPLLMRSLKYAIERKQVSKQLEQMVAERNEAIDNLCSLNQTLDRRVAERTAQLEAALTQVHVSLAEKEVLLQEIHHRVKNNFQVVASLLNLQAGHIQDKQAPEIFQAIQDRVKSMALVHEMLYQSSDLARIDFAKYVQSLVADLFYAHEVRRDTVTLKLNVADVSLDIDRAIPCGLIINELVSNCLKHAFPAGRKGEVRVDFHPDDGNRFTLAVSDNGVGFPDDLDFRHTTTLGLQLVRTLTGQLGGTMELDRSAGTTFKVAFTPPPP